MVFPQPTKTYPPTPGIYFFCHTDISSINPNDVRVSNNWVATWESVEHELGSTFCATAHKMRRDKFTANIVHPAAIRCTSNGKWIRVVVVGPIRSNREMDSFNQRTEDGSLPMYSGNQIALVCAHDESLDTNTNIK